ncbi:hypothetical protein BGX34_003388, partial [Mortierella sp. NVP85]
MPATHPLELAEILLLVVAYLPLRSLPPCARVSKAWYQACVPLIWGDIDLRKLPLSTALIQRHNHLVKKVNIVPMSSEYAALRFSNLDCIHLRSMYYVQDIDTTQFIMEHSTTIHLDLENLLSDLEPEFWDKLLGFHNLRHLTMSSIEIFGTNVDKFWQLYARLERIDIRVHRNIHSTLPPGEYPNIKRFGVKGLIVSNVPFFMDLMRKSPHLMSIDWRTTPPDEEGFIAGLSELLQANTLPDLEYLNTGTRHVDSDLFLRLVQNLPPRINTLIIGFSRDVFNLNFATLFQPHFSYFRVLEIGSAMDIKPPFAQLILSSCPLLEKLKAPHVDALIHLQPLVFDQLSKLTRLEELHMRGPGEFSNLGVAVDLRLLYGL